MRLNLAQLCMLVTALTLVWSCDNITYNSYDTKIPKRHTDLTAKNIRALQEAKPLDDGKLTFAAMGDPQRNHDALLPFIEDVHTRDDIDLVIIAGDLTHYGLTLEYEGFAEVMSELDVPWLTVIGNHDLLGKGEHVYRKMFGQENYVVDVGPYRLVFFDSNGIHIEDGRVRWVWLAGQLDPGSTSAEQAVVISHVPPANRYLVPDGEDPAVDTGRYRQIVQDSGLVNLTIHGHLHRFRKIDDLGEGIASYIVDDPDDRNYLVVTLEGSNASAERVKF